MTGESSVRRAEDIGGQELSYAEVKAIASGNPAVLTLAEADAELRRLLILKKQHADEQFIARRSVRLLPETIERLSKQLSELTEDQATAAAQAGDPIIIGNRECNGEDTMKLLAERFDSLPIKQTETRTVPLGNFRGLQFGLILHPHSASEVYLDGAGSRRTMLARDSHGPRAVLNALDRLAGGYQAQIETTRHDLAIAQIQLRDYQSRLGLPFVHAEYLATLTDRRDRLKSALSGTAADSSEQVQNSSEIANQIKAMRGSHSVEAAPERNAARRVTAEEPVSAKIRRLVGAYSDSGSVRNSAERLEREVQPSENATDCQAEMDTDESGKPAPEFRKRISISRVPAEFEAKLLQAGLRRIGREKLGPAH